MVYQQVYLLANYVLYLGLRALEKVLYLMCYSVLHLVKSKVDFQSRKMSLM